MSRYFDPQLINGPFDDPGLYVDLVFQRRALLFDLGDTSALPPRKLLRIGHVFITHRHMDHFIGFDNFLRCLLGRETTVGMWGTPGLIGAVESKLNAYTWNLVSGYDGNLVLEVSELSADGWIQRARFSGRDSFRREELPGSHCENGVVVADPGFSVRAVMLDHGIPVLGFALQERAGINIRRDRVEALGLAVGPWLRRFKDAIVTGAADDAKIGVAWADTGEKRPSEFPLGELKEQIMTLTRGRKIAYVADVAFTRKNSEIITDLAADADILFIEATFLEADADHAAARRHLTAKQAGLLARRANVRKLKTFHYSPRYRGHEARLEHEAMAAFRGCST